MRQTKTAQRTLAIALGLMSAASMTVVAWGGQPPQAKTIHLVGSLSGVPVRHAGPPDTGTAYQLSGNGDVQPLGHVTVIGDLHAPGNIAHSQTTGTVTLTGAQGSITLALHGQGQSAFTAPTSALTFTVTGGTGRYAGVHGSGGASLTMTPQQRPPVVPGRPTPMYIRAATFILLLHGKPG